MTGDHQNDPGGATASKPPAEGDSVENAAARVGGRGPELLAADQTEIITGPGGPANRRRHGRVVARGAARREIDERLIIQALLMIAKDLERRDAWTQENLSGD